MNRLLVCASALALGACAADGTDYRDTAEKTIRDEIKKQTGNDVTVTCEEPATVDTGATFDCRAQGPDGPLQFVATISGRNSLTIEDAAG